MHIAAKRIAPAAPGFYSDQNRRERHAAHRLIRVVDKLLALRQELSTIRNTVDYATAQVTYAADLDLHEAIMRLTDRAAELRGLRGEDL
jgi:hypothetical protein